MFWGGFIFTMKSYKYFEIDKNGYISIKGKMSFYWFTSQELRPTSKLKILVHLSEKNWFTEDMFFELLAIAKETWPNENFDRVIFDCAFRFGRLLNIQGVKKILQ
jgi:hypothetical protein